MYLMLEKMWVYLGNSHYSQSEVTQHIVLILKEFHITTIEVIHTIEQTVVGHFKKIEEQKKKKEAAAKKLKEVKHKVSGLLKSSSTLTEIHTILTKI